MGAAAAPAQVIQLYKSVFECLKLPKDVKFLPLTVSNISCFRKGLFQP